MLRTLPLVFLTAFGLSNFARAQGAVAGPCFQTNFGANLALTDDSVAVGLPLGFNFPKPGGGTVPSISVSSNGFVWLGVRADSGCCNGDVTKLTSQMARIAPLWLDLDPGAGGAVWFNTFPAGGGLPASAVVTWDAVPEFGFPQPLTFQLQLFADGSFATFYDPNVGAVAQPQGHVAVCGVSEGNGAMANYIDMSQAALAPIDSLTNPTMYEDFTFQGALDLAATTWTYVPNGQGGYTLSAKSGCSFASATAFGGGCPQPLTTYELFDPTSNQFDLANTALEFTRLPTGGYAVTPAVGFFPPGAVQPAFFDDESRGPFALPFSFAYPGGATNSIDITSNGFIWLQSGNNTARCCDGDPLQLVIDPASICALWMDLDPTSAPATGGIFYDVVGNTEVHITWVDVPEYATFNNNTFQITLRSNGSFRLAWANANCLGHDCLVGLTTAPSGINPGPTDLSQGAFTTPSGGIPLGLQAQGGSRPKLGGTFLMELDRVDPAAVLGFLVLGLSQLPGIDLGPIGMPGCALYASLDSLQTVPLTVGAPTTVPLPLPASPALSGVVLQAQGATLTPGATPLGLVSSNGLELLLGAL
jgi:hypothetical protein